MGTILGAIVWGSFPMAVVYEIENSLGKQQSGQIIIRGGCIMFGKIIGLRTCFFFNVFLSIFMYRFQAVPIIRIVTSH